VPLGLQKKLPRPGLLEAEAVFVALPDTGGDDFLFDYYQSVAESVSIPLTIHDFPGSSGARIKSGLVGRLGREGHMHAVKMEEHPVGRKITPILEQLNDADQMRVFGGLGGVYFLEELQRGAAGTLTGFAFPEIVVAIYDHFVKVEFDMAAECSIGTCGFYLTA